MSNIDYTQIIPAAHGVEVARAKARAELARIRWQRAAEGITLPGGPVLPGDDTSRIALTGALTALQSGMLTAPLQWKAAGGFIALSQADVEAAAAAMVQHIQACFNAEASVLAEIEALDDPTGFDIKAAFGAAFGAACEGVGDDPD